MDNPDRRSTSSQMSSVLRSFQVLEAVAAQQPVSLKELSSRFPHSKSTLQRTLMTLEAAGWIQQSAPDIPKWEITTRALMVRPKASRDTDLYSRAREPMTKLRDLTNETVHLSVLNELSHMVLIDRVDCNQAIRTFSPLGDSSPLHATATGKAVLAYLPEQEIEAVISRGLRSFANNTIVDADALRKDLEETRERGYSTNESEYRAQVCAIGAPIFESNGRPVGSICVSIPLMRYDRADAPRLGRMVRETADEISAGHAR
ncbi:IclR family transcriptional regulator [Glycomyces tenuis]|uniref:IclR family transcriptional regulator n=1 Tax=Glycomyces tenuis TaxID=58116 RepID=UPI0004133EEE|nr:IclR family transcriptional regulator [Glycomyces tenuis]